MTKTDKQFISRLFQKLDKKIDKKFGSLDQKIDGLDEHLSGRIDGLDSRFTGLDAKVTGLDAKIDKVKDELMTEICHEGVLRERSDHNIEILVEGYRGLSERMERIETSIVPIGKNTDLIPVLWTVVKDHGHRLAALEKR